MTVPTKNTYEQAMETVKAYEKRQKELKWIQNELSRKIKEFNQVKFRVNKDKKEIVFAGVHKESGKLKLETTKATTGDKFDVNTGKLIAIKKALKEDLEDVIKLIERDNIGTFTINTKGLFISEQPDYGYPKIYMHDDSLSITD